MKQQKPHKKQKEFLNHFLLALYICCPQKLILYFLLEKKLTTNIKNLLLTQWLKFILIYQHALLNHLLYQKNDLTIETKAATINSSIIGGNDSSETVENTFFLEYCSLNINVNIKIQLALTPTYFAWIKFFTKHGLIIIGAIPTSWIIKEIKIII